MKCVLLGTGTSHGVPVIGCDCPICLSKNSKDKRFRCSALITGNDGTKILIDCGPEFRMQALKYSIKKIDGLCLTHSHADHLHGLDDLRIFSNTVAMKKKESFKPLKIYSNKETLQDLKKRFDYVFKSTQEGGGKPVFACVDVGNYTLENPLTIGSLVLVPVPIIHGKINVCGWLIKEKKDGVSNENALAYITDCNFICEKSLNIIKNVKHLVIDGLRLKKHQTHYNFYEAIEIGEKIQAKNTWLTHICHDFSFNDIEAICSKISSSVHCSYDGLEL